MRSSTAQWRRIFNYVRSGEVRTAGDERKPSERAEQRKEFEFQHVQPPSKCSDQHRPNGARRLRLSITCNSRANTEPGLIMVVNEAARRPRRTRSVRDSDSNSRVCPDSEGGSFIIPMG